MVDLGGFTDLFCLLPKQECVELLRHVPDCRLNFNKVSQLLVSADFRSFLLSLISRSKKIASKAFSGC